MENQEFFTFGYETNPRIFQENINVCFQDVFVAEWRKTLCGWSVERWGSLRTSRVFEIACVA